MSLESDIKEVFGKTPRYAMYTAAGNKMVHAVVERAKRNFWNWELTYGALKQLARNHPEIAGEATDTAVRECVYDKLGFDTPFYI